MSFYYRSLIKMWLALWRLFGAPAFRLAEIQFVFTYDKPNHILDFLQHGNDPQLLRLLLKTGLY
jgi:hypothetical protein